LPLWRTGHLVKVVHGGFSLTQQKYLAYNPDMPTPFYHLSIAQDILLREDLSIPVKYILKQNKDAFLLGNVAPDVQMLSGQTRQSTHFFDLPIKNNRMTPWENLLHTYPGFAQWAELPADQATFIAGYLCHLQADWLWVRNIFVPVFGLKSDWGTFPQRLYYHNVLRAYIDLKLLPGLNHGIKYQLGQATPDGWLPFVSDENLYNWRDYLARQLQPDGKIYTVEVFAQRQGISPKDYYGMIASEETMDREIFSHMPRQVIDDYRDRLLFENINLLTEYVLVGKTVFSSI
jgi:hypothetical protein